MTYSGTCISGPLDRQSVEHGHYAYTIIDHDNADHFTYRFLSFTDHTGGEACGFWIPETWSTLHTIRYLAQHYTATGA